MAKTVLLTGATGFLGQWVLHQELEETDDRLLLPIRADDDQAARRRLHDLIRYRFGKLAREHAQRTTALASDLTKPNLGLGQAAIEQIVAETTHVIHSASNVSWTLSLAQARPINVGGTAAVWELAAQAREGGQLERALHVSTIGVAGRRGGVFYEAERDVGQRFHNTYERTKWEAEHLVEQMRRQVPSTIARPGAIVGEAATGVTEAWNALYYVWRIYRRYARMGIRIFPCDANTAVDPVPVDWVARACRRLLDDPAAEGLTVHLAQGFDRAPLARAVLSDGAHALGYGRPIFVPLRAFAPLDVAVLRLASLAGPFARQARAAEAYFELAQGAGVVDCSVARRLLGPHGLEPPRWTQFREQMFRYMARARLGRRAPATYPERRKLALA